MLKNIKILVKPNSSGNDHEKEGILKIIYYLKTYNKNYKKYSTPFNSFL